MAELSIRLKDGFTLVLPASLNSITTYVMLEQETWFEKESAFLDRWLLSGMNAIDIGANLGFYSLLLARRVGPQGKVFAFEPASEPRGLLKRSRNINQADNLQVIAMAMSDSKRTGQLALGASSELNSLGGGGPGEDVEISCLDLEDQSRGWGAIDFMKIDAEGEEERILAGGKSFFERQSPLIMFEIKDASGINENLRAAFPKLGFKVYRLLNGAPVLVPDAPDQPVDAYELNLFAAKPDRAAALAGAGLLVDEVLEWKPDDTARRIGVEMIAAQAFGSAIMGLFKGDINLDGAYADGLAGYAAWRSHRLPLATRVAALDLACRALQHACETAPNIARLSTLARAAWDAGRRTTCVIALKMLADFIGRGALMFQEPFWPASPRFDGVAPDGRLGQWIMVSAFEQLERVVSYSSLYGGSEIELDWLCAQPFASTEMERRRVLKLARAGQRVDVPERLRVSASDHLNAETWRAGLVPNTAVTVADTAPAAQAG